MPQSSSAGFTLLETVIAFGILASAIMGLLITLKTSVDAAKTLQRETEVRNGLENRLARLRLNPRSEFRQESSADKTGVTYIEEVVPEKVIKSDYTVLSGYRRIRVTAKWQDPHIEEREASFLVFVP
jgi:type II secretory pathway pseudopilin PulG